MGIPNKHPEGHKDPTAAAAINNIEQEQKRIYVGCRVRYKGKIRKVEYISWWRGDKTVQLKGVNGLVPLKEVKKV